MRIGGTDSSTSRCPECPGPGSRESRLALTSGFATCGDTKNRRRRERNGNRVHRSGRAVHRRACERVRQEDTSARVSESTRAIFVIRFVAGGGAKQRVFPPRPSRRRSWQPQREARVGHGTSREGYWYRTDARARTRPPAFTPPPAYDSGSSDRLGRNSNIRKKPKMETTEAFTNPDGTAWDPPSRETMEACGNAPVKREFLRPLPPIPSDPKPPASDGSGTDGGTNGGKSKRAQKPKATACTPKVKREHQT